MNDAFKYIELCAGIGGFRLGVESSISNAKCVYAVDIDKDCEKTYYSNHGDYFNVKNIFNINSNDIPEFDMLCTGFPCQPFSVAGAQYGFLDQRGQIFFKISEIIQSLKPSILFIENVKNLVSHDKGKTFEFILKKIKEMDYIVFHKVIDSKLFGLPQSRPRVYIVAFHKEKYNSINFQFPESNGIKKTIREILDIGNTSIPISKKWERYIDLYTNKLSINDIDFEVPKTRKKLEKIAKGCNVEDCVFQIRSSGIRAYSLDDVFPTFAVSHSGGGAMIPVLSKERRHLSLLEMTRLMGFPDSFKFPVSRTSSIKQLANAVCPPVISAIMDTIEKAVSKRTY